MSVAASALPPYPIRLAYRALPKQNAAQIAKTGSGPSWREEGNFRGTLNSDLGHFSC